MFIRPHSRFVGSVSVAVLASIAGTSMAQPMPVERRTLGVLAADTQLEAIYLLRDLDNDGAATGAGETTVYLDATNASNMPFASASVFVVVQGADGSVYIGDGDSDTVYRARDLNGDNDVQDLGEVTVWRQTSAEFPMPTPNGIGFDSTGAIYIVSAGVPAQGTTGAVYRTIDLDNDGAATSPGEVSRWLDFPAVVGTNSPFEIAFVGDTAYIADLRAGLADAIYRARDTNGDNVITADEINIFIEDGNAFGVPCSFSAISDGTSVFVHESAANTVQQIFALRDVDSSGSIDAAKEAREVWNENFIPEGATFGNSFSIAIGSNGMMAVSTNGAEAVDNVFLLRDLDGGGDYLQAGETTVMQRGNEAKFAENVRALAFIAPPAAVCRPDWNNDGILNSQDFFDFLAAFFGNTADYNGDGTVNSQDFFDYLTGFFAGC